MMKEVFGTPEQMEVSFMAILALLARAREVSIFVEPEDAPEAENEVLGELPDDLKGLKTVIGEEVVVANRLVDKLNGPSLAEKGAVLKELEARKGNLEILETIFWREIEERFPAVEGKVIGLCKGWKIVISVPKKKEGGCDNPFCPIHGKGGLLESLGAAR